MQATMGMAEATRLCRHPAVRQEEPHHRIPGRHDTVRAPVIVGLIATTSVLSSSQRERRLAFLRLPTGAPAFRGAFKLEVPCGSRSPRVASARRRFGSRLGERARCSWTGPKQL